MYWHILTCTDRYWHVLTHTDTNWHTLTHTDMYWLVLTCIDTLKSQNDQICKMGKWTTNAWPNDPTNSETKKRSCYERLKWLTLPKRQLIIYCNFICLVFYLKSTHFLLILLRLSGINIFRNIESAQTPREQLIYL